MTEPAITGNNRGRSRIAKALAAFNASLPRNGRVQRQARRCLIAHDGVASMRELRGWAYPGQPRRHWHHTNIRRALDRLGARRVGWGVWALETYLAKLIEPTCERDTERDIAAKS